MKYLLTLAVFCTQFSYGQYNLALNLQKGSTYFLTIHATLHANGEMNGQKMAMNSTMTGITSFKVIGATETGYELEASYDSMHMTMRSPMGQMEFSSGKSMQDGEMTSGALDMMTKKHFNITLLKNGAVSKITNPDTSGMMSMMKNFPMADGFKKMFLMGHFKQSFSKEAMKANLEKMTAIFPNKKVNINDVWGSTIMPDSSSDHMVKISYQLVDYKSGVATIKGHSESKATDGGKQNMIFPATYHFDGKSESTIQVDAATGWIKEAEFKNDLSGLLQMKDGPAMKGGKPMPVQITTTAKITGQL